MWNGPLGRVFRLRSMANSLIFNMPPSSLRPVLDRADVTLHACEKPLYEDSRPVSFYIYRIHPVPPHSSLVRAMEDPRFCSACGLGPFVNIQNHLNKCKESRKRENAFLETSRGKRRDFAPNKEVLRQRRQPPDLTPQVRTNGFTVCCF